MITKEMYIRNQKIIRNRMIREYTPKVYAALQSQVYAAIAAIKKNGLVSAQGNIHGSILNTEIGKVITELYRTSAVQAKKKYKPNIKSFGDNQDFIDKVMEYFKKYLLQKVVVPISRTTTDFIEKTLQQAIANGWGVDKTVKQLEDSDITKNRARMIVRTETVKATNFTQLSAADDEDFEMEKEWIAVEDNRTRLSHSHAGVDGQVVDLDQPFSNGLFYPGDENGDAEEVINCRCTLGYRAKRDMNGRLIPKTSPTLFIGDRMNINRVAA